MPRNLERSYVISTIKRCEARTPNVQNSSVRPQGLHEAATAICGDMTTASDNQYIIALKSEGEISRKLNLAEDYSRGNSKSDRDGELQDDQDRAENSQSPFARKCLRAGPRQA